MTHTMLFRNSATDGDVTDLSTAFARLKKLFSFLSVERFHDFADIL